MKNKFSCQKFTVFLILCLAQIYTVCAQTDSIPTEYIEFHSQYRLPLVVTSQTDTILEKYIIFNVNDIDSIGELVILSKSSEDVYSCEQLLSGNQNIELRDSKVFINVGKADQDPIFFIIDSDEQRTNIPLWDSDNNIFIFPDSIEVSQSTE